MQVHGVAGLMEHDWRGEFGDVFADKRVLVTGCGGFLGMHVTEVLVSLGADVHGIELPVAASRLSESTPWITNVSAVDLVDESDTAEAFERIRPEIVLHLAGMVDTRRSLDMVSPTLRSNLVATVNVLSASVSADVRRVLVTGSAEEIVDESGPPSPYAASKLALAPYVQLFSGEYRLPIAPVRLFLTYGPGQPPARLIAYTISELLHGREPVIKSGERICDFIFAGDVVRGILTAAVAEDAVGRVSDIGTGVAATIRDVTETLAHMTQGRVRFEPSDAAHPRHVAFETGQRLTGWSPAWSLREGLEITLDHYRRASGRDGERP